MRKIRSNLLITTVSIAFIYVTGCATQSEPDDYAAVQPSCPRDMKMECVKRHGQVTKCSCVTPGEMAEMLEDLTNFGIH